MDPQGTSGRTPTRRPQRAPRLLSPPELDRRTCPRRQAQSSGVISAPLSPARSASPNARKGRRPIGRRESRDASGVSRWLFSSRETPSGSVFPPPSAGLPSPPPHRRPSSFPSRRLGVAGEIFFSCCYCCRRRRPWAPLPPTPFPPPRPRPRTQGNQSGEGGSEASRRAARPLPSGREARSRAAGRAGEAWPPTPRCRGAPASSPTQQGGPERRRGGERGGGAGEPVGWGWGAGGSLKGSPGRPRAEPLWGRGWGVPVSLGADV